MEAFLLLWWLVKNTRAQCHLHGETAPAVHAREVQTSFRCRSRAQIAAAALQHMCVLCGGPDLADMARARSLQTKEELLTAPL